MKNAIFAIIVLATTASLNAQSPQGLSDARKLYDSGKYREAVSAADGAAAAAEDTGPRLLYLKALSYQKLANGDGAKAAYQELAGNANPAWAAIGRSGVATIDKNFDEAAATAGEAVEQGGSLPEAHYQRGIVLAFRREFADAAREFDSATMLDSTFAAAHYYGGLAEYRANRLDRMANHFEAFLKLAPNAPERGEVESIMRTVRGR